MGTEGTKEGFRGMDQLEENTVALTPQRRDATRNLEGTIDDDELTSAAPSDTTAPTAAPPTSAAPTTAPVSKLGR